MADERFSLIMNLTNKAVTQSTVNNFNSFCKMGDLYLAANEDGIYTINECGGADGTNINAHFVTVRTDFGFSNMKRIRCLYIAGEFTGDMEVEVTADERITKKYLMSPLYSKLEQHGFKVPLSRNIVGGWWSFKFSNINGADFSIDAVYANVMVLGRKPRISPA